MIAQELLVVPKLSVAENVFLGTEPRRSGWVQRRALHRRYEELAQRAGFGLPADRAAGSLRTAEQQQVEILRALARDARLLVMDEPSACAQPDRHRALARDHSLAGGCGHHGTARLALPSRGARAADTVTVLRDGRLVRSGVASEETEESLIQAMLGRPLGAAFPPKPPQRARRADRAVRPRTERPGDRQHLARGARRAKSSGSPGLVGAGRSELARVIFGSARRAHGAVELADGQLAAGGPATALRRGLAMIPESRKDEGLLFGRSAIENATLSSLAGYSRMGIVNRRAERSAAREMLERIELKAASYDAPVSSLSGGNQQKVLFARMLMCNPRVLLADEPTRGVDVGAKRAIYDLITDLARHGMGVLLISSEIEEILGLTHRVLVMRRGRIVCRAVRRAR